MTTATRIQLAEDQVAELQDALSTVQSGLQRMESLATAAEALKTRSERMMRLTLGLVGFSIVVALVLLWRRRKASE